MYLIVQAQPVACNLKTVQKVIALIYREPGALPQLHRIAFALLRERSLSMLRIIHYMHL